MCRSGERERVDRMSAHSDSPYLAGRPTDVFPEHHHAATPEQARDMLDWGRRLCHAIRSGEQRGQPLTRETLQRIENALSHELRVRQLQRERLRSLKETTEQ